MMISKYRLLQALRYDNKVCPKKQVLFLEFSYFYIFAKNRGDFGFIPALLDACSGLAAPIPAEAGAAWHQKFALLSQGRSEKDHKPVV